MSAQCPPKARIAAWVSRLRANGVRRRAHELLPFLREARAELRETLTILRWTPARLDAETILAVRDAAGARWFDGHFLRKFS